MFYKPQSLPGSKSSLMEYPLSAQRLLISEASPPGPVLLLKAPLLRFSIIIISSLQLQDELHYSGTQEVLHLVAQPYIPCILLALYSHFLVYARHFCAPPDVHS